MNQRVHERCNTPPVTSEGGETPPLQSPYLEGDRETGKRSGIGVPDWGTERHPASKFIRSRGSAGGSRLRFRQKFPTRLFHLLDRHRENALRLVERIATIAAAGAAGKFV